MFIVHSGELVVSKLLDSGRVFAWRVSSPVIFFGEMTLISKCRTIGHRGRGEPNRAVTSSRPRTLPMLQADIHAYVMVMQNINRELCRRLAAPTIALPSCRCFTLVNDAGSRPPCGLRPMSGVGSKALFLPWASHFRSSHVNAPKAEVNGFPTTKDRSRQCADKSSVQTRASYPALSSKPREVSRMCLAPVFAKSGRFTSS